MFYCKQTPKFLFTCILFLFFIYLTCPRCSSRHTSILASIPSIPYIVSTFLFYIWLCTSLFPNIFLLSILTNFFYSSKYLPCIIQLVLSGNFYIYPFLFFKYSLPRCSLHITPHFPLVLYIFTPFFTLNFLSSLQLQTNLQSSYF